MQGYVVNDTNPALPLAVKVNGAPVDLTTATAQQLRWVKPDGTSALVTLTIVNAVAGTLLRTWVAGDLAETGYHEGSIVITWADGTTQTFPDNGQAVLWAVYPFPGTAGDTIFWSDVLAIAPELSTISDRTAVDLIEYVNEMDLTQLCESAFTARLAKLYLAAHLGSLDKRANSGAAGPVVGEAAGGVRRSYGLLPLGDATWLGSTYYGQSLMALLSMSLAHGPIVV